MYDSLAHPPTDGLDRTDCEYLAFEDSRITAAANARAAELFDTFDSAALLAIAELQDLAHAIRARGAAYRAAQLNAPHRPITPTRKPR
ncbi:hypothetical protein [Amycolatopsis minnesotensis]|uniref:hypothetical protein n=1 Tax=Amycolatopsis minnesotensis TaxID=337894 RepID=UPI0031D34E10